MRPHRGAAPDLTHADHQAHDEVLETQRLSRYKTEVKAYCPLSRKQAALYQEVVQALAEALEDAEGIRRMGVVLAFLMRFKQICNHPSQWLGDGAFAEDDSGKWARLRELSEVIGSGPPRRRAGGCAMAGQEFL